jgi:hypothetical protein
VLPILQALDAWSTRHIPERWTSPEWFLRGMPEQFYPPSAAT